MTSDLTTEDPEQTELADLLAEYTQCHWSKTCREDAAYLLVCYKCNASHLICGDHFENLGEEFGKAIVFHADECKHICLLENMEIWPI